MVLKIMHLPDQLAHTSTKDLVGLSSEDITPGTTAAIRATAGSLQSAVMISWVNAEATLNILYIFESGTNL